MRKVADIFATLVILGAVGALVIWFSINLEQEYHAKPYVIDGDTLKLGKEKIRLEGIDAPEHDQTCTLKGVNYFCGAKSRQYLIGLVGGADVLCKAWQRGKYGRLLGTCFAGEIELNAKMVKSGWAVAYGDYNREEEFAREHKNGIWAGKFMRPREWRLSAVKLVEPGRKAGQDRWWKFW